jgi:hypothetical protein
MHAMTSHIPPWERYRPGHPRRDLLLYIAVATRPTYADYKSFCANGGRIAFTAAEIRAAGGWAAVVARARLMLQGKDGIELRRSRPSGLSTGASL